MESRCATYYSLQTQEFRRLPRFAGTTARKFKPAVVIQSMSGRITLAKRLRARFSRLLTVPRLQPVISAISS